MYLVRNSYLFCLKSKLNIIYLKQNLQNKKNKVYFVVVLLNIIAIANLFTEIFIFFLHIAYFFY